MTSIQILHLSKGRMSGAIFSFHFIFLRVYFVAKAKDLNYMHSSWLIWLACTCHAVHSSYLNNLMHGSRPAHELFPHSNSIHIGNTFLWVSKHLRVPCAFSRLLSNNLLHLQKSLGEEREAMMLENLARKNKIILMGKDNSSWFRNGQVS